MSRAGMSPAYRSYAASDVIMLSVQCEKYGGFNMSPLSPYWNYASSESLPEVPPCYTRDVVEARVCPGCLQVGSAHLVGGMYGYGTCVLKSTHTPREHTDMQVFPCGDRCSHLEILRLIKYSLLWIPGKHHSVTVRGIVPRSMHTTTSSVRFCWES